VCGIVTLQQLSAFCLYPDTNNISNSGQKGEPAFAITVPGEKGEKGQQGLTGTPGAAGVRGDKGV